MKTESDHVLDIGKNTGGKYLSKGFNFVWNFLRFDGNSCLNLYFYKILGMPWKKLIIMVILIN